MACFKKEPDRLLQQSIELPRFEAKPLLCLKLNCLWLCTSHSLWEVIFWIMFSIIIIWRILLMHAAYCMHGRSASSQPFHTMWHAHEILLRAFESPSASTICWFDWDSPCWSMCCEGHVVNAIAPGEWYVPHGVKNPPQKAAKDVPSVPPPSCDLFSFNMMIKNWATVQCLVDSPPPQGILWCSGTIRPCTQLTCTLERAASFVISEKEMWPTK